ncbi:uncharacterized protein LOC130991190 isoform X2 [Salvia miltiorrhiza]|uniref:uncharacterized protein LOC130991190 isoform X2 n=1 Tax=Salvia miltiorrhiza TaxID=226208 RepID=UPI0025AD2D9B|nr:uncharacterized protein LOC130991190 isoform X2 [Salvia miltiorrhiza]
MGTSRGTKMILIMLALSFIRVASSEAGRVLTGSNMTSAGSTDMNETIRVDPLNKLKKYRGGYNVTNDHYWSSTVFTGIPGYAIALIWLLCGLGYGILLLERTGCCKRGRKRKNKPSCYEQYHLQPLLLASFCTLLAVTACGLAFGGNSKSHSRAKTVIDILLDTADGASSTIFNITGAMKEISHNLQQVDDKTKKLINSTTIKLETQASSIKTHATENRQLIQNGLKTSYAVTTVTIALTLLVVISLLGFGVSKFQRPFQVLIPVCWMLTVLCWLFFGIGFFLQKALEGFQKNPYNNSLSPILPCEELLSAKPMLNNVTTEIHNLVNKVNENISISYGGVIQICNPFSPPPAHDYQPWNCPNTSVRIGDIPKVIEQVACPDTQTTCNGGILVPANYYNTIGAYCTSIQILLDEFPSIEGLVECRPVKDAFSEILQKHCKPLRRYIRLLWSALLFLSLVLVILVLIWTIKEHHDQTHHSSGGSIKPHNCGIIESGATNHTYDDSEDGPEQ